MLPLTAAHAPTWSGFRKSIEAHYDDVTAIAFTRRLWPQWAWFPTSVGVGYCGRRALASETLHSIPPVRAVAAPPMTVIPA